MGTNVVSVLAHHAHTSGATTHELAVIACVVCLAILRLVYVARSGARS